MANNPLNIIVESHVPFMDVLSSVATVSRLHGADINPDSVRDADALIVRTRDRCNAALLQGSKVSFVGTATIGFDHIDLPWCAANGIEAVNAPGCNAPAVAQYVFGTLMRVINRPIGQYTIGIVGVGHVGQIVERWARSLGMKVMLSDPPRRRTEGGDNWHSLAEIAEKADIITFHTPLTREGDDATFHLAGETFFNSLRRAPIIVNAARGPVVDTHALIEALRAGVVSHAIIDCWEGEPSINRELLDLATIATPHIAGYSLAGKQRASQMMLTALCRHFGLPDLTITDAGGNAIVTPPVARTIASYTALNGYDPMPDDRALRANPEAFESLRDNYSLRPELPETKPF